MAAIMITRAGTMAAGTTDIILGGGAIITVIAIVGGVGVIGTADAGTRGGGTDQD